MYNLKIFPEFKSIRYFSFFKLSLFLCLYFIFSNQHVRAQNLSKWKVVRVIDFGMGISTKSDIGINRSGSGFYFGGRALEYGIGWGRVGIGTTAWDYMGGSSGGKGDPPLKTYSHGMPDSFFPVNFYVPLAWKNKRLGRLRVRNSSLLLEISGSAWASRSNYVRMGLSWDFGAMAIDMTDNGRLTPACWTLRAGVFRVNSYKVKEITVDDRIGFFISAGITWGGVIER